jgi:hypothetical protein
MVLRAVAMSCCAMFSHVYDLPAALAAVKGGAAAAGAGDGADAAAAGNR